MSDHFSRSLRREVSISMAVAKTKLLSFFSCIIYLMGTVDSTQDVYRNIWAVKVRGSLQDAKQLSFKHGFVYDKHVSSSSLTLVKSTQNPFQYHHCIVETRIAKNGNCIVYQERKTRQAKTPVRSHSAVLQNGFKKRYKRAVTTLAAVVANFQGHPWPTTVFCKITARGSKNCLEFSIAWGRVKISR